MKISRIVIDNQTPVSTFSGFSKENLDLDNTFTDINDYSREITVATESIIDAVNDIDHLSKMAFSLENAHRFSRVDSQLVSLSLSKYRSKYGIASYEISTEDDDTENPKKASNQSKSFLGKIWDKIKALFKWIGDVFRKFINKVKDFYKLIINKIRRKKNLSDFEFDFEKDIDKFYVDYYIQGGTFDVNKFNEFKKEYPNFKTNPRYEAIIKEGKDFPLTTSIKATEAGTDSYYELIKELANEREGWYSLISVFKDIKEIISNNVSTKTINEAFDWEGNDKGNISNFYDSKIWRLDITLIGKCIINSGDVVFVNNNKIKDKYIRYATMKEDDDTDLKSLAYTESLLKLSSEWAELMKNNWDKKPNFQNDVEDPKVLANRLNNFAKAISGTTQFFNVATKHESKMLSLIEKVIEESFIISQL